MEDDLSRQADEVEALESIYPNEWKVENEATSSYSIRLIFVTLYINLPHNYPSQSPPTYQLSGPELTSKEKREIALLLDETYLENIGEPVLFQWIEAVRNYLSEREGLQQRLNMEDIQPGNSESDGSSDDPVPIPIPLTHGSIITDRRSTFQGHVAIVTSVEEIKAVLADLKNNRKICGALHNVYAYRIKKSKSIIIQDCDDDGEAQAGRKLLHLLQMMDVDGAIVIVSRWYGGIHLGPDRFKHYNNAARDVISLLAENICK